MDVDKKILSSSWIAETKEFLERKKESDNAVLEPKSALLYTVLTVLIGAVLVILLPLTMFFGGWDYPVLILYIIGVVLICRWVARRENLQIDDEDEQQNEASPNR